VAIWATNVPHWVTLMFAAARIGAILLTVNTSYRDSELCYQMRQSECENLFLIDGFRDHDYIATLYSVVPELRIHPRGSLRSAALPHLKRVMFLGVEKHRGMYSLPEILCMRGMVTAEEYEARKAAVNPHDVVNMQYTSGTTGFPKGVMLTHVGIGNNGYWIGRNQLLSAADRVCLPVPLFHCFGCVLGVMACVNHGATMVILESFSPVHVMAAVEQEKCTALYGVPTMFLAVLEHKLFSRFSYSTLRTGIMSGAVCPEPLMRRVLHDMNMREITIPYGLTEASPVMTQTTTEETLERRCQTVGRAMPGVEVIIRDPATGEKLAPHDVGEICCRGYSIMKGYYNMPEATAQAIDSDGWLHSGDLGFMDDDGYLRITGRIKDMIIRGGENIYPREVEEFLLGMPEIRDVQVVAVPSRKYGEEVGAFIIARPGQSVRPEDVRDFCRGHIAWHKIPRYVAMVDAFPQTASGKIQKYKLREMASGLFPEAMQ
jgi:fatty-acyl-CoA synthase